MSGNNGGPAFPVHDYVCDAGEVRITGGMTLRDYFAAKAMQSFVNRIGRHESEIIAHDSYIIADAMLKAREA